MRTGSPRHSGFSLIEVLIVVAIIGILAGIAVPRFFEMRDRAENAQCKGNLHAVFVAMSSYKTDTQRYPLADGTAGRFPSPNKTELGNAPAANGSWNGVPYLLEELGYLSDASAFYCPVLQRILRERAENFRYAYNASAADTGGMQGGQHDLENDTGDVWLARCLFLHPSQTFNPRQVYPAPHNQKSDENVLYTDGRIVEEEFVAKQFRE